MLKELIFVKRIESKKNILILEYIFNFSNNLNTIDF
jgi:hypothetical protein